MNNPNQDDTTVEQLVDEIVHSEVSDECDVDEDDSEDNKTEILPTDIVFNCTNCDHELVIDFRGAGLTVNCTECNQPMEVPIPEGMLVSDLDKSSEQLFAMLLHARRTISNNEQRIAELEGMVEGLSEKRSSMEKSRIASLHRSAELTALCQNLQRHQTDMAAILARITAALADDQS